MKKIIKLLSISILLIFASFSAKAQIADANELYDMFRFEEASKIYLKVITKNLRGKEQATERLADCYKFLGQKEEAEKWYATAVEYPDVTNKAFFNYGVVLRDNGKYVQAKEQFLKYASLAPADLKGPLYASYMDEVMAWEKNKPAQKRSGGMSVTGAATLNTAFDDLGAIALSPDALVFASTRPNDEKEKKKKNPEAAKLKLWQTGVKIADNIPAFTEATLLQPVTRATADVAIGPASFTADGKMMFYSQSYSERDSYGEIVEGFGIMYCTREGNGWSKPTPFQYNSLEYSNAHPTISSDGKLLIYTSDMPGGYGATDLYACRFNNGRWEKPRNMGANINTAEVEKYPVICSDTALYFSSNGHITLGGQDIMKSVYRDGSWSKAENMRLPINSIADDYMFCPLKGEQLAIFTSNRNGGKGGADLYIYGPKSAAPLLLAGRVEVEAIVKPNMKLTLRADNAAPTAVKLSDRGQYAEAVKDGRTYILHISADGYLPDSITVVVKDDNVRDTIQAPRSLVLKPVPTAPVVAVAAAEKPKAQEAKPEKATPQKEEVKKTEPAPQPEAKKEEHKPAPAAAEPKKSEPASQPEVKKEEPKPAPAAKPAEAAPTPKAEAAAVAPVVVVAPISEPAVKKDEAQKVEPTVAAEPKKQEVKPASTAKPAEPTPAPKAEVAAAPAKAEVQKTEPAAQPEARQAEPQSALATTPTEQPQKSAVAPQQKQFKNIYFDKNSIYPAKKSYGTIANLLSYLKKNTNLYVRFDVFSDAQGSEGVNLDISQRRAKVLSAYMQQQGIAAERISTAAYGDVKPTNRCKPAVECTEEEHAENRRAEIYILTSQSGNATTIVTKDELLIENQILNSVSNDIAAQSSEPSQAKAAAQGKVKQFRNISYAMNSIYPDKSSYGNIANLIIFMESHPNAVVELDVHSDAQGSESASMQVSDRRAKILSDYLQQNGIDENRIVMRSYGSTRPLNKCSVGVTCSDEENAVNRRVEVRVKY